jgi:hypothetical protein
LPNARVHSAGLKTDEKNRGASWSAVRKAVSYLMDSKKCFCIIRAALSLLKSVYDFPHNPKVGALSALLARSSQDANPKLTPHNSPFNQVRPMSSSGTIVNAGKPYPLALQ